MIRVMIVEDEPPIQRSIREAIDHFGEFRVVACANHGKAALPLLESHRPDVIFTDIRMPLMDGLELMSHLSAHAPGILVIVISGYNDFELVKEAFKQNAYDYILKPISIPEIHGLLDKIARELKVREEKARKTELTRALLTGEHAPALRAAPGAGQKLSVLLFCAGPLPVFADDDLLPAKELWESVRLQETAGGLARPGELVWAFSGNTQVEKIVLISSPQLDEARASHFAQELFSRIRHSRAAVTASVSSVFDDMGDIKPTVQRLRNGLYRSIVPGANQLLLPGGAGAGQSEVLSGINMEDSVGILRMVLEARNAEALRNELEKLMAALRDVRCPQFRIEKIFRYLFSRCEAALNRSLPGTPPDAESETEINEAVCNSLDYTELCQNMVFVFMTLFSPAGAADAEKKDAAAETAEEIRAYLQKNYAGPVNNASLSRVFGFVPAYLSKIFRAHTGVSPGQYLTDLRIRRAKELLLQNPGYMSKEVALMVGYTDPLYFSRIFKKETGISPSEYRKTN